MLGLHRPHPESERKGALRLAAIVLWGISFAVFAAELPPEDLEALPYAAGQIRLTWIDVTSDEDGFVVERTTETGSWIQVAGINELPAGSTEYIDTVGPLREKYTYRVASSHTDILSARSDTSAALPVLTDMPLHGWLDVTDYSTCTISGVTDPHRIQCAIEDLGGRISPGTDPAIGPHVLFFPDGEYLIDQTLFLEGRAGVQFVGESPGGVVLKWTGGPGAGPDDTKVMFHAEGNRDSTWRNLVWDGDCVDPDNCFVVAFDQSFCGQAEGRILRSPDCGPASLGWPESETLGESDIGAAHVDSVFRNAFVGLRLGHYGVADDTSTLRRCQFVDNFVGVSLEDFNALNHTVWDSLFQGNFVGISNDIAGVRKEYDPAYSPGICQGQTGEPACFYRSDCDTGISCVWTRRWAGDFDIYRGRFIANAHTDVWAEPVGEFIVRDSWATGSGRFFFGAGLNGNPGRYTLLNNTIWDDQGLAIETRTPGTFLFADNHVYTDPGATDAPVVLDSLVGFDHPDSGKIDLIAVDNVYSIADPYDFRKAFRLRQFGDQTTSTPPPVSIPPLPTVQESLDGRPIYTVTDAATPDATANAARIQAVIDAALADPLPAIVHLPGLEGRHQIDQTLHIPAAADLILTGDGKYTTIQWVGVPGAPILQIDAAQVDGLTIRDLQLLYGGVLVENLSQDNAHALLTQVRVAQSSAAGVVIQDLDTVKLNFVSFAGEHGLIVGSESVGMLVKAGPAPIPDPDRLGVAVWSGTMLKHNWDYLVINDQAGAKVLISGNYMEVSEHHLRVQGDGADGTVTVHGSKIAPTVILDDPADPVEMAEKTASVSIEDFQGNVSLVETTMFVAPTGFSVSSPEAVDHGARVRVVGTQAADVDVQTLGNTLRRQPSVVDPDDPTLDADEYDFFDAPPDTVDFLRLSGKRAIASAFPLPDIHADEVDPLNPVPVATLTPEQESQFFAGLELLRTMPLPQFYEESGASDPQQVNFDRVFIFKASPVGLVLSGGISCSGTGDCVDAVACTADSCDLSGLPTDVPGQCRFVPEDSLCDDGDACTANSCDPLTGCSNDPITCDDGDLCNGVETCDSLLGCEAGTPLNCDDADDCTADSCDPLSGCLNPIACDDGLFCNGVETCDPAGGCQPGTPVDCDDSVSCTTDSCNEATDTCDHLPDDSICDNGLFCDGVETCDAVADCLTGSDPCTAQTCNETTEDCSPVPRMEVGTVTVGGGHLTVSLDNTYANAVVVCSVQYASNNTPVVARVSNVTSMSFDVRLQNPSDGAVATENVSYVVVEEGVWDFDGVAIEAQTYTSTVTDENDSWIAEAQNYAQGYSNPVVLGQVMTENDTGWSVFWCSSDNRKRPPSASALRTGKTVCEDTDVTRLDETVGFIVIDAGSGTIDGVPFEAGLGPDSIRGVGNSPPYTYAFDSPFPAAPAIVVTAMAGVGNSNGGWSQSHGPTPATTTSLFLSIDEDQVLDSERNHGTERVGYLVFESAFAVQNCGSQADCDDGVFCNGAEECVGGTCLAGTAADCDDGVSCTTDACDEGIDACDNSPVDSACDNGLFCDGVEICDSISDCQAGSDPCPGVPCDESGDVCLECLIDADCDDGAFCNGAETCSVGSCKTGAFSVDDGVGCTTDACDEVTDSITNTPVDAVCDNGLFCDGAETCDAVDDCQPGSDPCPGQSCDEFGDVCAGCLVDADCDDGEFCNGAETCDETLNCQTGTPPVVDDGVACTDDSCDEINDVVVNATNDAFCDNGAFCDGAETCDETLNCQAGTPPVVADGVACTDDSCDEANDVVVNATDDAFCDNGAFCDGAETCDAVTDCQAGTPPVTDDGVSCTDDSCDEINDVVVNATNDAFCDNALFCDGAETCDAALDCQAGNDPCPGQSCDESGDVCADCLIDADCDDGVSCTVDVCNSGICANTPDDANCDNGDFCDGAETCDAALDCQAGTPPVTDDGVSCTDDSCDEINDVVVNATNDAFCDNALFCDGAETCDAALDCQAGTPPVVDDGVVCTDDSCDETNDVVVNATNDAFCDNGAFCDGAETCDEALDCQAGTPPVTDDGVSCTDDSCDEINDVVVNATNDAFCDNALFCDGAETCDAALDCQAGNDPCPGQSCDESGDVCADCLIDADCDDGVSCTVDVCNSGICANTPDDANCDNGDFCDGAETCDAALDCQAGTPPVTDDGVSCTDDSCDEINDVVVNATNDAFCDNGAFCDGAETCDEALDCQAGTPPVTDDGVSCTDDSCDEINDVVVNATNDAFCDNGAFCDGAETCDAVTDCQAGTPPVTDDGVACTGDSCDEINDVVVNATNDAFCDNGAFCDGAETCDAVTDCQAGTPPVTDDGVSCTDDSCDEINDVVVNATNDAFCDNALFCDGAETCDAALDCQAGNDPCPGQSCDESGDVCADCLIDADCDDGVSCTVDVCNSGICANTPDDANCDNGDFCDGAETCDAALDCQAGTPPVTDDGVSCTDDSCDEINDVVVNATNDAFCDNALFCDGAETCDAALDCQAGTPPVVDDGVVCTDDSCDETNDVVVNATNDAFCDNGAFCDGAETCDEALDCQAGTPPVTDDGVSCTGDSCDEINDVVVNATNDAFCDNALFCDGAETCDAALDCQAGNDPCPGQSCDESGDVCADCLIDADCDDGVSCTVDVCNSGICANTPDDANCDNGDFCDGAETCDAALDCQAGTPPVTDDGVSCTDDSCDEINDVVVNATNDAFCDNGAFCDGAETCDEALDCQAGTPPVTDDGVSCTDDSCDEINDVVVNATNDAFCDNGAFCDGAETCDAVTDCQAGTPPVTDDGVACTGDSCDEINDVVVNATNDAFCDNGAFCDGAETCDAVTDCQAGTPPVTDDGVSCTDDSCDEINDVVVNATNDAFCDNALFCDGAETCDAALDCQAGNDPCPGQSCDESGDVCADCLIDADCDDGVSCTVDVCNSGICANTPDDANCDNGDFCDGAETCDAALDCQAGTPPVTDDGVSCTDDSCDEINDVVVNATNDAFCDNALFCDGAETCDAALDCQAGTPPVVDDGVVCTDDSCDETNDVVVNATNDAFCDNGAFCDGAETCDEALDCQAGTPPVTDDGVSCTDDSCDEINDVVVNATNDAFCDNALFCDGAEFCDDVNDCQPGSDPCPGQSCDESGKTCADCLVNADCDDGAFCNGAETCNAGTCQAGTPPSVDDGVGCTTDACDEATDSITHTPVDAACDNGLFCDGFEICDTANDCQAGTAVDCTDGVGCTTDTCNEGANSCDNTPVDAVCDNGLFCDGVETCDAVNDCQAGSDPCGGQTCDEVGDACAVASAPRLETGTVTAGNSYVLVPLINAYVSPVVVCSVQYDANTAPVVTRVHNVTSTSFEVRLQNPSSGPVAAEIVNYLVVEEGVWNIDGVLIEAWTYASTVTDEDDSWVGEDQVYGQSYTAPVVLGQVMSENDPNWSVFWCRGSSTTEPPVPTALRTGKTVCEDPNVIRADETIGVIVLEAGSGTIGGVEYEAALGADTVRGVSQNPPYAYTFNSGFAASPVVAVVTMAGMDGVNGGWAQTHGTIQATATTLFLSMDEDQVGDSERSHTTEQVGYAVFETAFAFEETTGCVVPADCDDGLFCNGSEDCVDGACQAGTPVACDDGIGCTVDACDEATDSCDSTPDNNTCDNGVFCDGVETCDPVADCLAGIPVTCQDSVGCTVDSCNEATDSCDNVPDNSACDNGIFCDGSEICDPLADCQAGTPSCDDGVGCTVDSCDEATDSCDNTPVDAACDNGLFCDGTETCSPVTDCQPGPDPCPGQTCNESGDLCESGPVAQLETGLLVVGGTPVTVDLANTYVSPVVVCSVQYSNNTTPVVARVSNVTSTSFDVRLQNPSDGSVVADSVSYIVVEEGVWTIDGVAIEAQVYTSSITDENNSWTGEVQGYGHSYGSPVVFGQVMTENDPAWSVFWCQGDSRSSPPAASTLRTGKTVCEDGDVARSDEIVGFIVIEAGGGTIGGVVFEAALGPDSVAGVDDSPPYVYSFNSAFSGAPTIAITTMAGVDGGNGGWAQGHGPTLATTTSLFLSVDEDQINDPERNHTAEQVGYLVFETTVVYP